MESGVVLSVLRKPAVVRLASSGRPLTVKSIQPSRLGGWRWPEFPGHLAGGCARGLGWVLLVGQEVVPGRSLCSCQAQLPH